MKEEVIHPLEVLKDKDSKILILGSFPSVKSREMNFFYMNKTNRFYKVLSSLLDIDLFSISIEEKKRILLKNHIALYDVVKRCRIHGSSDSSLQILDYSDIYEILKNTKINKIYLNGSLAYSLFIKKYPELLNVSYKLPSTSSANAKMKLEDLVSSWSIILEELRK
ncbi:MAG: DNA-deoxyinosine glycosylase [Bacilli bacterium]|nr:DNA-deoxyinosine glycosylase [Bacilli bacterium]